MPYPVKICCEKGCDKPVDRPRSKVRCAEHYQEPRYGGHTPFIQKTAKQRKGNPS